MSEQRGNKVRSACWTEVNERQTEVWTQRLRRDEGQDRHISCRSERAVDGSSVFSTRPLTAQLPAELFSSASCLSLTAKEGTVISPAGNRSARAMLNTLACSFQVPILWMRKLRLRVAPGLPLT